MERRGGIYKATLQQALDDAWKGKFSVLIIWSLDRLTRGGAEDALRVLRQFRQRGCTVVCVQEWRLLVPGSMGSGYGCRGSGSVSLRRWMRR